MFYWRKNSSLIIYQLFNIALSDLHCLHMLTLMF